MTKRRSEAIGVFRIIDIERRHERRLVVVSLMLTALQFRPDDVKIFLNKWRLIASFKFDLRYIANHMLRVNVTT